MTNDEILRLRKLAEAGLSVQAFFGLTEFHMAANPAAILSLLDSLADMQRERDGARDANKILTDTIERRAATYRAEFEYSKSLGEQVESLTADLAKLREQVPEELFDGYSVLKQIDECRHVSADHVALVLDAVVRLIRARTASSPPQPEDRSQP